LSFLLHNLLHFGRLLRSLGLDVHAGRMLDVAAALEHIDIGRRSDLYFALQSLLIHRQQDLQIFDEAFRVFWRRPPDGWSTTDLRAMGEQRRSGAPEVDVPAAQPASSSDDSMPTLRDAIERTAPMSYSPQDAARVKDFAELSEKELEEAKRTIAAMAWDLGTRRTRRWVPGRGRALDFRKVVRRNLRHGGEPLALPRRERASRRRPLVLLCDVSGSMERYGRMLLNFIQGLAGGLEHVEAFLFATRLTRITRELARRGHRRPRPFIAQRVPDWAGGTRIGDALRTFNVRWARRVMGHGPVVLLISDGWDRGDPELLAREMSRLQRSCHRLIWLNPLLGAADYQPLTRGMQAALPFVDDFLPVHNLASLEALAKHLERLPAHRGARTRRSRLGLGAEYPIS
jgi:uncharacterized protein with von Willebrand factor type A (vWA) domain